MAQPQTYGSTQETDAPDTVDLTKEEGRQVAEQTRQQAGAVAGTAKEQAGNVANEALGHARDLAGSAKQQLHHQARQQTDALGGALGTLGGRVQALADGDVDGAGPLGDYAQRIAGQVDQAAGRVQQLGFDGMIDEVQRYARRKPGAFLLGAAVAGLAVSRLARGAQSGKQHDATISGPSAMGDSGAGSDPITSAREMPSNPAASTSPATATGMTGGASVAASPPPPPMPRTADPATGGSSNDIGRDPR